MNGYGKMKTIEDYTADELSAKIEAIKAEREKTANALKRYEEELLQSAVVESARIRKLTPRECWRLMGVKDEQFDRLHGINTQLYKMAGNSIVVDGLMAIFKNLLISDKETKGQLSLF